MRFDTAYVKPPVLWNDFLFQFLHKALHVRVHVPSPSRNVYKSSIRLAFHTACWHVGTINATKSWLRISLWIMSTQGDLIIKSFCAKFHHDQHLSIHPSIHHRYHTHLYRLFNQPARHWHSFNLNNLYYQCSISLICVVSSWTIWLSNSSSFGN